MKSPILALAVLTVAANAQVMPAKRAPGPDIFSIGVSYASVSDSGQVMPKAGKIRTDGVTVDLRAAVANGAFLTASYTDLSFSEPLIPDAKTYSIGFGTKFSAGNGAIELAYAYAEVDVNNIDDFAQHVLKVGYTLDLGNGLEVGIALVEFLNTEDFAGLELENVTAPVVSVAYKFGQGFSANLALSTENSLFGLADAGSTVSLGVRYGF